MTVHTESTEPDFKTRKSMNDEVLSPESISVFTTTYYKGWRPDVVDLNNVDTSRGNVSLVTFERAIDAGYRVVVIDGGSSVEYIDKLKGLGVTVLPQIGRGMVQAKREALTASVDQHPLIHVLIQAEKDSVIGNIPAIVRPIIDNTADLVMVGRNPKLFAETYPGFQHESEVWGNKWCNRLADFLGFLPNGVSFDWFFGVKAFRNTPRVVDYFMQKYRVVNDSTLNPDRYTNFDFFPILAMLSFGDRVVSVDIPFKYPPEQKDMEELRASEFIEKRAMQRRTILKEFALYIRWLTALESTNKRRKLVLE